VGDMLMSWRASERSGSSFFWIVAYDAWCGVYDVKPLGYTRKAGVAVSSFFFTEAKCIGQRC
jgi:hypothetical protein